MTLSDRMEALETGIRQTRRCHRGVLELMEALDEMIRPFRDAPDGQSWTPLAGTVAEAAGQASAELRRTRRALEELMAGLELRMAPLEILARTRNRQESRLMESEYRRMAGGRF